MWTVKRFSLIQIGHIVRAILIENNVASSAKLFDEGRLTILGLREWFVLRHGRKCCDMRSRTVTREHHCFAVRCVRERLFQKSKTVKFEICLPVSCLVKV